MLSVFVPYVESKAGCTNRSGNGETGTRRRAVHRAPTGNVRQKRNENEDTRKERVDVCQGKGECEMS